MNNYLLGQGIKKVGRSKNRDVEEGNLSQKIQTLELHNNNDPLLPHFKAINTNRNLVHVNKLEKAGCLKETLTKSEEAFNQLVQFFGV